MRTPAICLFVLLALMAGCGFHLRGIGDTPALPKWLSQVRIEMPGVGVNEPILLTTRETLRQAGAEITDDTAVPLLKLYNETTDSQVASVRATTGKASEYTLNYSISFIIEGPSSFGPEAVRLQREYTFDPARVVSKEYEERELLNEMRREAAQQIVRRLGRAMPIAP